MKIVKANGKKSIKISKKEWEGIGRKAGWDSVVEGDEGTVIKGTPDRIDNLRNIANFIIENCPRGGDPLMHKLNGYGEQLLIIARDIEGKLNLLNFRLEENPKGWD
ncbi:hypothetical protein D4R86_04720 [bacterium]|nr:MAG: hypothetical protein D4R86_04720 [bacterium]